MLSIFISQRRRSFLQTLFLRQKSLKAAENRFKAAVKTLWQSHKSVRRGVFKRQLAEENAESSSCKIGLKIPYNHFKITWRDLIHNELDDEGLFTHSLSRRSNSAGENVHLCCELNDGICKHVNESCTRLTGKQRQNENINDIICNLPRLDPCLFYFYSSRNPVKSSCRGW